MNEVLTVVIAAAAFFYGSVHVGLALGLGRKRLAGGNERPFVSVIIAARNEESTIRPLLLQLRQQTYSQYEVIVVNDRSTDRTREVVEEMQLAWPGIRCIDSAQNLDAMPAKKNALRTGIEESRGEILCFTDADCLPSAKWIETLISTFDARTGMVAGYSPYREPSGSWLDRFIAYEEFRGAVWSAGSIGWNAAWLCTGRNLAYRRQVFDEVGGFDLIRMSVSGDDDLMMQSVRRKTRWSIRYCFEPENLVWTDPPSGFREFVNQRRRHFSAGEYFSIPMKLFFSFYHGSNFVLTASLLLLFTTDIRSIAVVGVIAKFLADSILVFAGFLAFRPAIRMESYPLMELLYAFYNLFIGPLGFIGGFRWKESA
jgi:biofilm PGA synthesis N-glycosyltransferase PgaC